MVAYRKRIVPSSDNRALRAAARFRGDVLLVESEHDQIVPHPAIASYLQAFFECPLAHLPDHRWSRSRAVGRRQPAGLCQPAGELADGDGRTHHIRHARGSARVSRRPNAMSRRPPLRAKAFHSPPSARCTEWRGLYPAKHRALGWSSTRVAMPLQPPSMTFSPSYLGVAGTEKNTVSVSSKRGHYASSRARALPRSADAGTPGWPVAVLR
ncbi:hypothetical protein OKW32_006679 [Paraburkholderia youngii]